MGRSSLLKGEYWSHGAVNRVALVAIDELNHSLVRPIRGVALRRCQEVLRPIRQPDGRPRPVRYRGFALRKAI
jgi:hypothetical protein